MRRLTPLKSKRDLKARAEMDTRVNRRGLGHKDLETGVLIVLR